MENIAVILLLAVVAVLAIWIFKYVSGNIPSMTTSEIEDIKLGYLKNFTTMCIISTPPALLLTGVRQDTPYRQPPSSNIYARTNKVR